MNVEETPRQDSQEDSQEVSQEPRWKRLYQGDNEAIELSAQAVKDGHCIVLPTDTVYGIGANAFSADAVAALLDAKERGTDMPAPVLIAEPAMMRALTSNPSVAAKDLADAFWPGALTLILPAQRSTNLQIGSKDDSVAVRVPDHDWARELLRRTGPLAVSSANKSGQAAALNVDDAITQLGDSVAVYLDAGPLGGGVASTIVDFTVSHLGRIVRLGALTLEQLRDIVPGIEYDDPNEALDLTESKETSDSEPDDLANVSDTPEHTPEANVTDDVLDDATAKE